MAYTPTTWTNGGAPAINATNLNKIEQGIVDASVSGETLIQTLTAADLQLNSGDSNSFNTWAFDLTDVPAPPTGYRLIADFFHTADILLEDTIYNDVNQDLGSGNPDGDWNWNNYGQARIKDADSSVEVFRASLGWQSAQHMPNIRGYRIVQDYIPIQIGGVDVCIGNGIHTQFDVRPGKMTVAHLDTYNPQTTTELNGKFLNIVHYNIVKNGGSFDLQSNPLEVCELSLYAI
jgi:hypothetical protein